MQAERRQHARVGAYGIVTRFDATEVLLCRLSDQVANYAGFWTLPGGGMEFGEHPEETVVREVEEETGLAVKPTRLLGIDNITRQTDAEDFQSIRIIYATEVIRGELVFELDGTTDRCEWHALDAVPELKLVSLVEAGLEMTGLFNNL